VEDLDVRRRVGARRAADRRLVDVDDLVDVFDASDALVGADGVRLTIFLAVGFFLRLLRAKSIPAQQSFLENVVDQRTFARAADAGDTHKEPQGDFDVDVLEVILPRTQNL